MADSADSLSVSVALCTHNGSPFVGPQLRSVLGQSPPPEQLVVSDDASTDSTLADVHAEIDSFVAKNPKVNLDGVILQNSEPLGVLRNFEQAVSKCTGDLIALCDQDDWWIPERLAIFTAAFHRKPDTALLFSDARLVNEAGKWLGSSLFESIELSSTERVEVRSGNGLKTLLRRNVVTGATTVFRRNLLEYAVPFADPWLHDEWLAVLAAALGRIDYVPGQLIDYRQHSGNLVGAQKPTFHDKLEKLKLPREERSLRLVARAEALVDRLIALGPTVSQHTVALVRQKLQHEKLRARLPGTRLLRILPVLRGGLTGRYGRYGRARYDLLRDLFQPNR